MLIAKQKRKENIAEYLIYMWQIEDQIRAFKLNISAIEENIIAQYKVDDSTKKEIKEWYENLILMMQHEQLQEAGHLQITSNIVSDLNNTHLYLLSAAHEVKYQSLYFKAKPDIDLLMQKTNDENEIAACFHFLYGTLMLRLKKKNISAETEQSLKRISALISQLSLKHKNLEVGKDEFIV